MKIEFIEISGFRGFRARVRFEVPSGFLVLSGRNGVGKSTLFDAIDYALTGTINKFQVKGARGGGLDQHIWWVGDGSPDAEYVSVGFIGDGRDEPFVVTRDRRQGLNVEPSMITERLCQGAGAKAVTPETLLQTTLIRDELIAALSLDLPQASRFATVRAAIGTMSGPDWSQRTSTIFKAAQEAISQAQKREEQVKSEIGRLLGRITEARTEAAKSADLAEAMRAIDSISQAMPDEPAERAREVRSLLASGRKAVELLEVAVERTAAVTGEAEHLESEAFVAEQAAATSTLSSALALKDATGKRLADAHERDKSEREADEFAAHIAAIVEHGHAVGLQGGRCPLCDANRSDDEFQGAIAHAKARLAERGERLAKAAQEIREARAADSQEEAALRKAEERHTELKSRSERVRVERAAILESVRATGGEFELDDLGELSKRLEAERERLVVLDRSLRILDSSGAVDRVRVLEGQLTKLRVEEDLAAAKVASAQRSVELSKQIARATKSVENEMLTEQFDIVMPLLKELYRRLRPHAGWREIGYDFGGRVRASLNLQVGDGLNPQFLFSSGQRRAAGLAFLLAVHLSRPWCKWNSLLLDDPVQHIDDYRAINLVEVLAAIRRSNRQIIVAVEDDALADLLCRRLRSSASAPGRRYDLRTSDSGTGEVESEIDIRPMSDAVLTWAR